MKLLFPIGTIYPSQEGGPSNTVYWLAQELTNSGDQVWVIATNKGTKQHNVITDNWCESSCGYIMYTKEIHHLIPIKLVINAILTMRKVDLVHLTSLFYPASFPLAIWALMFRKKIVWSPRGELDDKALIYSKWKKLPLILLLRLFFKQRIFFHSTSRMETRFIVKNINCDRGRIIEIPNYFQIPKIHPMDISEKYLLYLGRIHPKKGIENLIKAVVISKELSRQGYFLKIAGDLNSSYGRSLIELVRALGIEEKIQFIGFVEGIDKEILFARAYCSIMPSHTENFGIVVIESLAQGTPVIASKGTPWEILVDEKVGDWVESSPDALATSIDKICSLSKKEYLAMRDRSRILATKFDIGANIHNWHNAYQSIMTK